MLDAACHKLSCTARVKSYIFDFIRQTMDDLPVDGHILSSVVHDHYDLEVVLSEAL